MSEVRSISDDDLCSDCQHCKYDPDAQSGCKLDWPGEINDNGYILMCDVFAKCAPGANLVNQTLRPLEHNAGA